MQNNLEKNYWTSVLRIASGFFFALLFVFICTHPLNAFEAHVVGVTAEINNYVCGDGNFNPGEECDDNNNENGDGCSATCVLEETASCMKINEVYYDPDSEHGDADDEWIELYNACEQPVNLKNWYLRDNNKEETIHQNYIIDPDQFVVIAANASTWQQYWSEIPDNAFKIALGGTKLFDGFHNDSDRVFLYDNHNNQIDEVSWGDDTSAFNPAVSDVEKGHSIARIEKGVDNNTASDWEDLSSPNPGTNPHSSQPQEEPEPEILLEKIKTEVLDNLNNFNNNQQNLNNSLEEQGSDNSEEGADNQEDAEGDAVEEEQNSGNTEQSQEPEDQEDTNQEEETESDSQGSEEESEQENNEDENPSQEQDPGNSENTEETQGEDNNSQDEDSQEEMNQEGNNEQNNAEEGKQNDPSEETSNDSSEEADDNPEENQNTTEEDNQNPNNPEETQK